jgi:hypothetical protein
MSPSQKKTLVGVTSSHQLMEQTLTRDAAHLRGGSQKPSKAGGEKLIEVDFSQKTDAAEHETTKASLDSTAIHADELARNKPESLAEGSLQENKGEHTYPPSKNKPLDSIGIKDTNVSKVGSAGPDAKSAETINGKEESEPLKSSPSTAKNESGEETRSSLQTGTLKEGTPPCVRPASVSSGPPKVMLAEIPNRSKSAETIDGKEESEPLKSSPSMAKNELGEETRSSLQTGTLKEGTPPYVRPASVSSGPPKVMLAEIPNRSKSAETIDGKEESEPLKSSPSTAKNELGEETRSSLQTGTLEEGTPPYVRPASVSSGPPKVIHAEIPSRSIPSQPPSSAYASQAAAMPTLPKKLSLRRGKWTVEEEAYVARVIEDFNSGFLNAPAGTTLRSYLSEKLQCDPMRITKKFTGDACIGKRVFHPAVRSVGNTSAIDKAQAELDALERRWRRRLEMQQRESAKKAAASAAAVNASPQDGRLHLVQGGPVLALLDTHGVQVPAGNNIQQTVVTQAASWLDRANAILAGSKPSNGVLEPTSSSSRERQSSDSIASNEIESQMQEVRRLIYEGPIIQQTAAGLPHLLSCDGPENTTATMNRVPMAGDQHISIEPADKRQRRTSLSSAEGAEDAEALVGFLRSVRASAASGPDVSD